MTLYLYFKRYQQIHEEITSSECHTKQRAAGLRIFQSKQDYFTVVMIRDLTPSICCVDFFYQTTSFEIQGSSIRFGTENLRV